MAPSGIDVEAETDRLYQLPLAEFITARNALAAQLKSAGDKENAARVKAFARPSISAWGANQAYWTARPEFDALVASTRRLQTAQAEGAAGKALREAMKERREARAALTACAESLLAGAGHGAGQDTLRRVSETLEALAVEATRPDDVRVRPGRLIADLEPRGFEAIVPLARAEVEPPVGVASPVAERVDAPRAAGLGLARAVLAEAERALERAKGDVQEATSARSVAEKQAQAARQEVEEVSRRLQGARERAGFAAAAEAAAKEKADRMAAARDRAEAARDASLRSVHDLE